MALVLEDITIGSDVEFFVKDKKSGDIITAEGLINGSKYEPDRFVEGNPYYGMQLDNVLAEGNIPPARTEDQFVEYLNFLRKSIDKKIGNKYETVALASTELKSQYLASDSAKTFGCDPSWSCWTNKMIEITPPEGTKLRSAGFHIHVGYKELSEETNIALARAMDLFLGVPASRVEKDETGRKLLGYAKAGNFRHQPHGLEYRTLSSFFVSEDKYIKWAYQQTQRAIEFVNQHPDVDYFKKSPNHEATYIPNIIENAKSYTNSDSLLGRFIKEYGLVIPT